MSITLNVKEHEATDGFKPFSNCWHDTRITDFQEDSNKNNSGRFVMLEFTIISGVDKGRTVRNYYNYAHTNEEAQRISREQLCAVAGAIGLQSIDIPGGLDQFRGKSLRIKTHQKPGADWPEIRQVEPAVKSGEGFSDLESGVAPANNQPPKAEQKPDPWA